MQARFAIGVLSRKYNLPSMLKEKQAGTWNLLRTEYATINTQNVYPVEQYAYCDMLAREMQIMPTLANVRSLQAWIKIMLAPASTTHYVDEYFDQQNIKQQNAYSPAILTALLILLQPIEFLFQLLKYIRNIKANDDETNHKIGNN
jgi:hypothetical protein